MNRILNTLGAGRLIGVALTAGIVIGALITVPLFASASGDAETPPQDSTDGSPGKLEIFDGFSLGSIFGADDELPASLGYEFGGTSEARLDSTTYEAPDGGGISFSFEARVGDGEPIRLGGDLIEKVAELTGTAEEDVEAALDDGQTLAEYAADYGVSEDELVDALVGDADERITEAVENGDLSQAEADRLQTELREHLSALVKGEGFFPGDAFPFAPPGVFGFFEEGDGPGGHIRLEFDPIESVADLTGTEEADVIAALRDGQSLAEFAAEHGVTEDELVDALMANARERAADAVADGDLTREEADEILARLEEHTRAMANGEGLAPGRHFGPFGFPFMPGGCDDDSDDSEDGESTSNQI